MSDKTSTQDVTNPLHDVKAVYHKLRQLELLDDLKQLQTMSSVRALGAALGDWLMILAVCALVAYHSWWWLPLALILAGSRQRALGNLLHEAGHWMFLPDRRWNDRVANLLIGIPSMSPMKEYRPAHLGHHAHLGSHEDDPDFIHDDAHLGIPPWSLFAIHLFDPTMFKINFRGHWHVLGARGRLAIVGWWAVASTIVYLAAGLEPLLAFLVVWWGARATVFHAITTFREISDHVGLEPGSTIGFTRNSPHRPVVSFFLHPHYNNYHLTHHLAPKVPFYNIARAHDLFMALPEYRDAHQCSAYFGPKGPAAVIWSWVGGGLR